MIRTASRLAAAILLSLASRAQPPAINQESVMNDASRMPSSLPGGALAPGMRIAIRGLRFGRTPRVRLSSKLQTAELTVVSSAPEETIALLPDKFPGGPAELTVSNQDGPSRPFPLIVIEGALGLYAENRAGRGPAKIAASSGNRVTLLGTGIAPAQPMHVFIGGRRARVLRIQPDGRDPGIGRLEIEIPANAPRGCNVPLLIQSAGGLVSNVVTIPVGTCDPNRDNPFAGTPVEDAGALVLLARLQVHSSSSVVNNQLEDFGAGIFAPVEDVEKVLGPYRYLPPEGTCTTYTDRYSGDIFRSLLPAQAGDFLQNGLDAGSELSVSGSNGVARVEQHKRRGTYGRIIGFSRSLSATGRPPFLSPGNYEVSWTGGPKVPVSAIRLSIPKPFTWTNASKIGIIDRHAPLTLRWQEAAGSRLAILALNVDPNTTALAACVCLAPRTATSFTIPAMMLANLPKSPEQVQPAIPMSLLALIPMNDLQRFHAPGLEIRALVTTAQARIVEYR